MLCSGAVACPQEEAFIEVEIEGSISGIELLCIVEAGLLSNP